MGMWVVLDEKCSGAVRVGSLLGIGFGWKRLVMGMGMGSGLVRR